MRKDGLPYGRDHNGRLHQVRRHHMPDTDSIQETSLGPKRFLDFAGESTTRPLDFII